MFLLSLTKHGGNGTASIFYEDPSVLMISIHCHPDWEYPFHTGFEDETGEGKGKGVTLNLPLRPGTTWAEYSVALKKATDTINSFGANALVISLGLDTLLGDPCAIKGAGFKLSGDDYKEMGRSVGKDCKLPTVVIQEGGYKLDDVPKAAADVVIGCAEGRC